MMIVEEHKNTKKWKLQTGGKIEQATMLKGGRKEEV